MENKKKVASLFLCLVLMATSANTVLRNLDHPAGWRFLFSLAGFLVFALFSLLIVKELWKQKTQEK